MVLNKNITRVLVSIQESKETTTTLARLSATTKQTQGHEVIRTRRFRAQKVCAMTSTRIGVATDNISFRALG